MNNAQQEALWDAWAKFRPYLTDDNKPDNVEVRSLDRDDEIHGDIPRIPDRPEQPDAVESQAEV